MKTITVKNVPVWLSKYSGPEALNSDKGNTIVNATHLFMPAKEGAPYGDWTRCGTATITYEFVDEKELVANKVTALEAELQKERAESEVKCNAILEQISKLQALEYTAGEVA